jgi:hypothetical protein
VRRPLCGSCLECLELSRLLIEAKPKVRRSRKRSKPVGSLVWLWHGADGSIDVPSLPVSVDALRRHAERYGTDGVKAVASVCGLDLNVRKVAELPKRRRRTTGQLVEEARLLRDRGMVPGAIADVLNVSDRRVKELLAEPELPEAA